MGGGGGGLRGEGGEGGGRDRKHGPCGSLSAITTTAIIQE